MNIRRLDLPDLPGLIDLISSIGASPPLSMEGMINVVGHAQYGGSDLHYVAIENGLVVGYIKLIIELKFIHNCGTVGHIEDVSVHPDHQKKGIATQLINTAIKKAKDCKCYKIILNCNKDVIELYKKCGFKEHNIGMRLDLTY